MGDITLKMPRDRNGTFEPQLVGKWQRRLAGFDAEILALYAKGMTPPRHPGGRQRPRRRGGVADAGVRDRRPRRRGECLAHATIYQSATVLEAEGALKTFGTKWGEKYPTIAKQWRAKWTDIITLFEFPTPISRASYTTNAIESANSVIRKFTRNRKQYPNGESALKLVYLAIHEASKKRTMPITGWKAALNHFAIVFEGRMPTRPSNC